MTSRNVPIAICIVALAMMVGSVALTGRETVPRRLAALMSLPPLPNSLAELASLRTISDAPPYSIDVISASPGGANVVRFHARPVDAITIRGNQSLTLNGWAYDGRSSEPARAMMLEIDRHDLIAITYGDARPDVGTFFRAATLTNVGFHASIPADRFGRGRHSIDLIVISADGSSYYRVVDRIMCYRT
jgi:hypothetical protein